jgi:hypothetical protein
MINMHKYIQDRSRQSKNKILRKARDEFGNVNTHIFYEQGTWWIRVFVQKLDNGEWDIVEYDVIIDENGVVGFEMRR